MKMRLFHFIIILVTLTLSLVRSPVSTAWAQGISLGQENVTVFLQLDGGPYPPVEIGTNNFGPSYAYGTSESYMYPSEGLEVGSVNAKAVVMQENNIFYVTCFDSASGSGSSGSGAEGDVEVTVNFSLSETNSFILQAETTYTNTEDEPPNFPQSYALLEGAHGVLMEVGQQGSITNPGYGYLTGTLVPGNYSIALYSDIDVATGGSFPSSDTQVAIEALSLVVYPPDGTGGYPTNNPTLGIGYGGTNTLLSWPLPYPNYLLTSSTNLSSTNWTVVSTPPTIVSNLWQVTLSPESTEFFRLVRQ